MANVTKPTVQVDPWTTDKSNWEYVSIPAENALGYPHDTISVNRHEFKAGQTYLIPPEVALDVKDRLKVYARATIRTLQPRRDYAAERQVSIGSASAAVAVDPSTLG